MYPKFYQDRTVAQQKARLPLEYQAHYETTQLDRIQLFNGRDIIELKGYFEYSYLEEKSYEEQPIRSSDGAIEEIDNYKTFLTPRLIVKYNMMGIEDYRKFMKLLKQYNGIIVQCYDLVEDKIVRNEMYVAPPQMPVIYQQYLMALGIQEYAIELIGTNTRSSINFSIGHYDTTTVYNYEGKKGMTWEDWVASEYNYDNYTIQGQYVMRNANDITAIARTGLDFVLPTDFVLTDEPYVERQMV